MITYLRGRLIEARPTRVVVEAGGVGYAVAIPLSTHNKLPPLNGEIELLVYHYFGTRFDPAQRLFGFLTIAEREMYEELLNVGAGPKVALNIVGGVSPEIFRHAVAAGDVKLIAVLPGVGKKLAERIVLELREKFSSTFAATIMGAKLSADQQRVADAVAALVSLGYKPSEAHQAVRRAVTKLGVKANVESLVRAALK